MTRRGRVQRDLPVGRLIIAAQMRLGESLRTTVASGSA